MALKRVAIYKGDTIQLCILPENEPKTLSAFDDLSGQRVRGKGCIFLGTNKGETFLSLDNHYLNDHPNSDIEVYNGNKLVGHMKFEPLK